MSFTFTGKRTTPSSVATTEDSIAWPIRCATCGEGEVFPVARPERTARYKNMAALPIQDDLAIPTSRACGTEWIDRPTAHAVDAALERRYQERLRELAGAPQSDRKEPSKGLTPHRVRPQGASERSDATSCQTPRSPRRV